MILIYEMKIEFIANDFINLSFFIYFVLIRLDSVPVMALAVGLIGHDWIFYIMSADMPKYLKDVLQLSIKEIGIYSSLPYLVMWIISILSGFLSDFLIARNITTITNARKIFSTLGKHCYQFNSWPKKGHLFDTIMHENFDCSIYALNANTSKLYTID